MKEEPKDGQIRMVENGKVIWAYLCTCHDGNNDCKEHPIWKFTDNEIEEIFKYCVDSKITWKDLVNYVKDSRKQACQEMIKHMEGERRDLNYEIGSGDVGSEYVIEAAKEYLKTL